MADFNRRRRFTTRRPRIAVAGTLPVGRHRFELVVEDESGNRSRPAQIEVIVVRNRLGPLPGDLFRPPIRR